MNDVVDRVLEPGLWFLASWSGRWAMIILLTWGWLRFLPPRRAAIRHLVCVSALFVGLTLPMMPAWELAVWMPLKRVPAPRTVSARLLEEDVSSGPLPEPLMVPDELPPGGREPSVTMTVVTAPDRPSSVQARHTAAAEPQSSRPAAAGRPFGARRYLILVLSASWAVGVLVGCSRLAYGLAGMRWLRRQSAEVEGPSQELIATCRATVRTKRDVRLASHPLVSSPLAVGMGRPMILVPEDWDAMSAASRRASLIHELQHLANYDDWLALLRAATGALFFFHPLVHWLLWRINYESELTCDDAALGAGITQRDYADVLLRFAQRPTTFQYRRLSRAACSISFGSRKTIKRRLLRLLDSERPWTLAPVSFRRRLLLAVVCFGLGRAMGGLTLKAAPQDGRQPPETIGASQVERHGGALAAKQETATAAKDVPKRVAKKRAPDGASLGIQFYHTEPMSDPIQGTAKDQDGQSLPGATVYLAMANKFSDSADQVLAKATTDDAGKYVFKDLMLKVQTFPAKPDVVEGRFQIFGVSDGHGFAWHGVRAYRPRPRPADDSEPDMDRAYYEGETITNDLLFGPTVGLAGRVVDDRGKPIAGAKVQIGVIDEQRRPGSKMYQFELLTPEDRLADSDRFFTSILSMPESRLSAMTDAAGRYQIAHVPRDAIFAATVSATPELGSSTATLTTSDKATKGNQSVIAQGWNPVLVAPRTVVVRTIDPASKGPLNGVVLHAYGRQMRHAGNEARSDADGRAVLQLPPGQYRLVAEPANGSLHVQTEQEIDVGQEPAEQAIELGVQSGALVVLQVADDDSKPVEGVGFTYETDASLDRRELESQTVFVDHPTTEGDGVLRAVIEPGRRRFFVGRLPDGYELADSEVPWTDVVAGRETEVRFEVRKMTQPADVPPDAADFEQRLQDLWRRQSDFKFKGSITYRMTNTVERDYVVTRDEIREVMTRFDPNAGVDIASWINENLPELNIRLTNPRQMLIDGQRHRCTKIASSWPGEQAIEVFNGAEVIRYDRMNAQVAVDDHRLAGFQIDRADDLRRWPRNVSRQQSNLNIVSRADGKVVLESGAGAGGRLVIDETTGFVYESSHYSQEVGVGNDEFQFAPIELPGGMIWPRVRVLLRYNRGELYTVNIHEISSIEPRSELPPDALVVSVPAGTLVLASDFGAAVSDRDRNQPGSHKQGMATGPVSDVVQFAYSLSPRTRSLWPVLKIGQDAPALNAAAWLTADGQTEVPDLKDKVVLVDFWSQRCGPCVAELPRLATLAKRYAKTDLRIVGWHDSSGDVEGVAKFARKHGLPYTLAIDHEADEPGWFGALFKSFGVRAIRQTALLDRQGKLVFVGNLSEAISRLENVLANVGQQNQ